MSVYAVISDNKVNNIIVAETLEDAEMASLHTCVDITNIDGVKIGTEYDGTEFNIEVYDFPNSNPNATLAE